MARSTPRWDGLHAAQGQLWEALGPQAVWARVRARELDRWMQTSGLGALPGRSKGAEEHGLLFALSLEYARARGEWAGGLALDFSKAYDRMDIDMLEHMARQARLPEWLWRPM